MVAIAVFVAWMVAAFVVQPFYVPSRSMQPGLDVGDRILVDKVTLKFRQPRRGEVIVFDGRGSFVGFRGAQQGDSGTDFVKRVIGLPGDRVACCDARGRITVNSGALDESGYLYADDVPSLTPFDVIVPEGKLWVMGDHRSESADSRSHLGDPGGGFVPISSVIGRELATIWPLSRSAADVGGRS